MGCSALRRSESPLGSFPQTHCCPVPDCTESGRCRHGVLVGHSVCGFPSARAAFSPTAWSVGVRNTSSPRSVRTVMRASRGVQSGRSRTDISPPSRLESAQRHIEPVAATHHGNSPGGRSYGSTNDFCRRAERWMLMQRVLANYSATNRGPSSTMATRSSNRSSSFSSTELSHRRIAEFRDQNAQLRHQLALGHGRLRHQSLTASTTPSAW